MLKLASLLIFGSLMMTAEVRVEKTAYQGWPNCYRVTNGEIELIVTSDIGPRIMRLGFPAGQNFFFEEPSSLGKSGEPAWVKRGGHRVWIAPEDPKYSYGPDNSPIDVKVQGGVVIAIARELGIPVTEPDYKVAFEASPMASVNGWKSPVLLIHGDDDRNVEFNQTVMLANALRSRHVPMELIVYPDEIHDFLLYRTWLAAYQASARFLDRQLK